MKKKRVLLHIGMHKTGTTAIQVFCSKNAGRLERLGFLYPLAGRPIVTDVSYGHHLLPWSLTHHISHPGFWPAGIQNHMDIWDVLQREIADSPCTTAILSSEEFDTLSAGQVAIIADRLSDFDVQLILYLRRLDELVQGMYTTDVVFNGAKSDVSEYKSSMRTPLEYDSLVDPWLTHFPITPTIRLYDSALLATGAVSDFLNTVGVDQPQIDELDSKEKINVGCWPWYVVEVCRQMNVQNLPSEIVVKFAFIMRDVVGKQAKYDVISPQEATGLIAQGYESLMRLKSKVDIPLSAEFVEDSTLIAGEEHWRRIHSEEHGAIIRVLQQLSRVVERK